MLKTLAEPLPEHSGARGSHILGCQNASLGSFLKSRFLGSMDLHFKAPLRMLMQVAFEPHIMKYSVNIQELCIYGVKWSTYLSQDWIKTNQENPSLVLPSLFLKEEWSCVVYQGSHLLPSSTLWHYGSLLSVFASANIAFIFSSSHGFCWLIYVYSWILLIVVSLCLSFSGADYCWAFFFSDSNPPRSALIGVVIITK